MSLLFVLGTSLFISNVIGGSEPPKYILSFPTKDNPLNITVDPSPENNYFILLGDWGCASGDTEGIQCQIGVAKKMQSFVSDQKSKGMNLLFVGVVGDNFYSMGQNCNDWNRPWINVYGDIAKDYNWLGVWGNHDWGGDDPNAMCAWNKPKYIDPITKIPYAANQLNADKGGCNPPNFYIPDFGYYYTINQLNFEWIGMDLNYGLCNAGLPGLDYSDCGSSKADGEKIGCAYMQKIQTATINMMNKRANISSNDNFFLIQHYAGGQLQHYNDQFKHIRGNNTDYRVWAAGGHTHTQQCVHNESNGICDQIMTGGGGHGNAGTLKGFFVIGFDENKKMIQPYKINDDLISCMPPCAQSGEGDEDKSFTKQDINKANFYLCCTDADESDLCDIHDFDTEKCSDI